MRLLHLTTAALLLAVATGCGNEAGGEDEGVASAAGGSSTTPSASPSASAGQADPLKFAQCMRANGVDMPDPDPNGGFSNLQIDRSNPKFMAAMEKCRQYAPFGNGDRTLSPEQQQQMLEFAKCMRANGVDMPDPDPNGGFNLGGRNIDRNDPKFQKAMEACRSKLPGGGIRFTNPSPKA
jgi:hypothetical protein